VLLFDSGLFDEIPRSARTKEGGKKSCYVSSVYAKEQNSGVTLSGFKSKLYFLMVVRDLRYINNIPCALYIPLLKQYEEQCYTYRVTINTNDSYVPNACEICGIKQAFNILTFSINIH
jgi:hypothetical protein